jgi:hypothetical protein
MAQLIKDLIVLSGILSTYRGSYQLIGYRIYDIFITAWWWKVPSEYTSLAHFYHLGATAQYSNWEKMLDIPPTVKFSH